MATSTAITASASEVRVRAVQLGRHFAIEIERAADSIRAVTDEPAVRRHALLWKMYAIPAAHEAVLLPDPAMSIMDIWAFAKQMERYFDGGAGRDVFGAHQQIALDDQFVGHAQFFDPEAVLQRGLIEQLLPAVAHLLFAFGGGAFRYFD